MEKVERLFEGLPATLKPKFVSNRPSTASAFIDKLGDVNRKLAYGQSALMQGLKVDGLNLPPQLLSQISFLAGKPAAVPLLANLFTASRAATSEKPSRLKN